MSDIKNFNKTSYQRLSHADNYNQHINKEGLQSPDLRDFKNYNKEYYTEAKEFQNIQKSPDIDAHKQHQEQQEDITSDIRDMIKLQQDKKTNTFQNIMNNLTRNMSDAHEKTNMQSQLTGKHNGLNPNKSCMSSDISNKKSPTKISNILASMHGKENSNLLSNHTQQNHIAKTLLNMDNGGVKVNQMLSEMNVLNSDRKVQGNSGNKGINNLNSMNMMNNMNARANKTSPHTKQQAIKKLTSLERQKYACENNEFQPSRSNSSESTIDKMKSHIIHENILEVLYSNGLDSQTKVGEMIFQMLKSMKKSGDPYELIRNYTDLIQDPIYDIIVEMFSDTFTQAEINNSLKLERWGIIFLFYFNLIGKLDEKISPNLINLLTHILQNFHILVELIHKNAKFYKKGHIMAKLRGILDCLNNPYMDVNSEVLTVLKRNNDIIKCNLKACVGYIPKNSHLALEKFLKNMHGWSLRFSLEKGFDAFIDYFKSQGVISVNWVGAIEHENLSNRETTANNNKEATQVALDEELSAQNVSQNTTNKNCDKKASGTKTPLSPKTPFERGTDDDYEESKERNNTSTPTTINNAQKRSMQTNNGNIIDDEELTIKNNAKEEPPEEDIPTANKSDKRKRHTKMGGSFEAYQASDQQGYGPSILFQPKTMEQRFLVPAIKPDRVYTLVLDLDETLIHFEESDEGNQFLIRPYAQHFIDEMSKYYELVIFTAGLKDYADFILDKIDLEGAITHRLYRHNTDFRNNVYTKDLSKTGRDLCKTLIVDNNPDNFQYQPENGIYIKSWYNDPNDKALIELAPLLKEIVVKNYADVRIALRQFRDKMIQRLKDGNSCPHLDLSLDLANRSLKLEL